MRWGLLGLLIIGMAVAEAVPPTLDYETTTKTATVSAISSDVTLWDPAADHRFVLLGCMINARAAGTVELEVSDVDVIPPIRFESTGTVVIGFGYAPLYVSAEDAILTYTTTAGLFSIMCAGYEEAVGD